VSNAKSQLYEAARPDLPFLMSEPPFYHNGRGLGLDITGNRGSIRALGNQAMSKSTNRKLRLEPVKKSAGAAAAGSFRARSATAPANTKADQDRGVKTSAARTERFRQQPIKHN
jgi:hypothetical protein